MKPRKLPPDPRRRQPNKPLTSRVPRPSLQGQSPSYLRRPRRPLRQGQRGEHAAPSTW
jgi:hypothetical protein